MVFLDLDRRRCARGGFLTLADQCIRRLGLHTQSLPLTRFILE